jgi:hypothetical protein
MPSSLFIVWRLFHISASGPVLWVHYTLWVLSKIYDSDFGINDEKKSEKYFHKWKKKEQNKIRISVAI